MKKCPFCSKEIQDEALKCRYCSKWLNKEKGQHSHLSALSYDKDDMSNIAKYQKIICWLVIAAFIPVINIFAQIAWIFCVYYLAIALKVDRPWAYVVGAFIPIVALVILLILIQKSTKVLRSHNIRVGLMGANKTDLNEFLATA